MFKWILSLKNQFIYFYFLALIFSGVIAFNYKVKADKKEDISDNKEVYLTFDDGPSDKTTENILDVLKRKWCKSYFFYNRKVYWRKRGYS